MRRREFLRRIWRTMRDLKTFREGCWQFRAKRRLSFRKSIFVFCITKFVEFFRSALIFPTVNSIALRMISLHPKQDSQVLSQLQRAMFRNRIGFAWRVPWD